MDKPNPSSSDQVPKSDGGSGAHAQDWSQYWSGRAGQSSGEALTGKVGVETDPEIAQFWTQALSGLPKSARFLDMACGAGSVIRRAHSLGLSDLTGADISPDAIATLKLEFDNVKGVVTSADHTPFNDGSFDVVTSQFGLEYAGALGAAKEISRILAPKGSFIALCHMQGGAIEREVSQKKSDADAIMDSGFIAASRELFKAAYGTDEAAFTAASQAFRVPQGKLLEIAKSRGGLAGHLYSGVQQLYTKVKNYAPKDVFGWLNGMEGEITAFQGRMGSMVEAALSREDADAISAELQSNGFTVEPMGVLSVREPTEEIAWIFQAVKGDI